MASSRASRLEPLQIRVLRLLAGMRPAWTLTGGAALAHVHLHHRPTRDLDLFWHGLNVLGREQRDVEARLRDAGLQVDTLREAESFRRLRVSDGHGVTVVDLVAEPVPASEPPMHAEIEQQRIQVDTAHEILVNKLCALLSRTEPRDLYDIRALLEHGGDLERALTDAARKDGGVSPMVLAWSVEQQGLQPAGEALGLSDTEVEALRHYRDDLVDRLVRLAAPGEE